MKEIKIGDTVYLECKVVNGYGPMVTLAPALPGPDTAVNAFSVGASQVVLKKDSDK